jgi:hypothetical protein
MLTDNEYLLDSSHQLHFASHLRELQAKSMVLSAVSYNRTSIALGAAYHHLKLQEILIPLP